MNVLTQLEMNDADIQAAEKWAEKLGYGKSTAYTSSSALIGLYCLPQRSGQRNGCIVKTAELGLIFMDVLGD